MKKIKRITIATAIVAIVVLIFGHFMSDDWSDFFSGVLVGMGGTWIVVLIIYLVTLLNKKNNND